MPSSNASDGEKIPKSSFEIYRTEGDALKRNGDNAKAIICYAQALELRPGDQHCLVNRSECYLNDGDSAKALADAEESLSQDKNYYKGIFQKAEVLYFKADFENALVFYHRGNKLRPENQCFRLGIQKAEEAINNAVGDPKVVTLKSDGDLTHFYNIEGDTKQKGKGRGYQKPKQQQETKKTLVRQKASTDNKTIKQLLGTLYADREYLEKILNEEDCMKRKTENSDSIRELTIEGLNYLDSRSEFWQQQKPMYSRKWDQKQLAAKKSKCASRGEGSQSARSVRESLDQIDDKLARNEFDQAFKQAENVLKQVEAWPEEEQNNKIRVVSNLYSIMGNCQLEQTEYTKALEFHNKDLDLGRDKGVDEAVSRAMDNIGRVYAKQGEYQKAIDTWEEKIPSSESPLEMTWLSHEIGRCHLELGSFDLAKSYGEKSLTSAREISDDSWQLNANVLIAQACVKLEDYPGATDSFEQALDFAKVLGNTDAEEAIKKAIDDVNQKTVEKVTEESKQEEGSAQIEEGEEKEDKKEDTAEAEDEKVKEDKVDKKEDHDDKKEEKKEDHDDKKEDHDGKKEDHDDKKEDKKEDHENNKDGTKHEGEKDEQVEDKKDEDVKSVHKEGEKA